MPPKIELQTSLVQPDALLLEMSVVWVRRADHSVTTLRVRDRPGGQQLALSVGTTADLRCPIELRHQLSELVKRLIYEVFTEYVDEDPF